MSASDVSNGHTIHGFVDSWFPKDIATRLDRVVWLLPATTLEDLKRLIGGEGIYFESVSSQRIAATCLRILGELLLGEALVLVARAEFELTHACNYHCEYCTSRRNEVTRRQGLDEDVVASLIDVYHRAGCKYVHLNGGEVSLVKHVPRLVRTAVELGMRVGISSNGSGGVDFYRQVVKAGLSYAHISFDSCFQNTFEMLTGMPGAWGRTTSCLSFLCVEAKRLNPQLLVVANVVLTDETLRSLPATTRYLIDLGVDEIKVMPSFVESRVSQTLRDDFQNSIKPEILAILGVGNRYPLFRMRLSRLFAGNIHGIERGEECLTGCDLQVDQAMVRADGSYGPCFICMTRNYEPEDYRMGHVAGGLGSRLVLARKKLRRAYIDNPTCAAHCPEMIRDANRRIQTVVADCVAAMLGSLDSGEGVAVDTVAVRCEDLHSFDEGDVPPPEGGTLLAIPKVYEAEVSRILRALAGLGVRVEAVNELRGAGLWRSGNPIMDTVLRSYAAQSGKGYVCYRVVSSCGVSRQKVAVSVKEEGVALRQLFVLLYSNDLLKAQARLVVPPVLTGGLPCDAIQGETAEV